MDEQRMRLRVEVLPKALDRALSTFVCLIYGVLRAIAFSQVKNLKDFGVQIFEINVADLQKVVAPVYDDFTKSVGGKDWAKQVLAVK
jgi:hypothetical protein